MTMCSNDAVLADKSGLQGGLVDLQRSMLYQ